MFIFSVFYCLFSCVLCVARNNTAVTWTTRLADGNHLQFHEEEIWNYSMKYQIRFRIPSSMLPLGHGYRNTLFLLSRCVKRQCESKAYTTLLLPSSCMHSLTHMFINIFRQLYLASLLLRYLPFVESLVTRAKACWHLWKTIDLAFPRRCIPSLASFGHAWSK